MFFMKTLFKGNFIKEVFCGHFIDEEKSTNMLQNQIAALKQVNQSKNDQALAKLDAAKVKFDNAENQYQRNKKLYDAGNIPLTKFQDMEYKYQGSQAEYLSAKIE